MRMWMLPPTLLCNRHLAGEHGEIHKHRHNFEKGHSIKGRLSPVVQIEPASMQTRHDALAAEMVARGMKHASPYSQPPLAAYSTQEQAARVNLAHSMADLVKRCPQCAERIDATFIPN